MLLAPIGRKEPISDHGRNHHARAGKAERVKLPSGRVATARNSSSLMELKFGFSSVGRYSTKAATGLPVVRFVTFPCTGRRRR